MNIDIYFWIESDDDFYEKVLEIDPSKKFGTIENRKKMIDGKMQLHGKYWKSNKLFAQQSETLELLINDLLTQSHGVIILAQESAISRIFLQIVSRSKTVEELSGFYFSSETLQRLAKLKIAIDIDQVRELKV